VHIYKHVSAATAADRREKLRALRGAGKPGDATNKKAPAWAPFLILAGRRI
jgi:hypothetical protein